MQAVRKSQLLPQTWQCIDLCALGFLSLLEVFSDVLLGFEDARPVETQKLMHKHYLKPLQAIDTAFNERHKEALKKWKRIHTPDLRKLGKEEKAARMCRFEQDRYMYEQELLAKEMEERFGKTYWGTFPLKIDKKTFTPNRALYFIANQYVDLPKKERRKEIITFVERTYDRHIMLENVGHQGNGSGRRPYAEMCSKAVSALHAKTMEILHKHAIPVNDVHKLYRIVPHQAKVEKMDQAERACLITDCLVNTFGILQLVRGGCLSLINRVVFEQNLKKEIPQAQGKTALEVTPILNHAVSEIKMRFSANDHEVDERQLESMLGESDINALNEQSALFSAELELPRDHLEDLTYLLETQLKDAPVAKERKVAGPVPPLDPESIESSFAQLSTSPKGSRFSARLMRVPSTVFSSSSATPRERRLTSGAPEKPRDLSTLHDYLGCFKSMLTVLKTVKG